MLQLKCDFKQLPIGPAQCLKKDMQASVIFEAFVALFVPLAQPFWHGQRAACIPSC